MPPASAEVGRAVPLLAPSPCRDATPAAAGLRRDNTLGGIGLVIASTVFFSISDIAAKHLTETLPAIQVAWLRYLVFCLIVLPPAFARGGGRSLATRHPGLQIVRGLAMVGSAIFFTLGLRSLPIADATAISFAAPIFIMALSVWILGERVGVRRWSAAVIGLFGVLLIVRPGSGAFQPAAILPIASAAVWACTVVATRMMSTTERPQTTLAWSAIVGFAVLSALVPFQWVTPGLPEIGFGLLIGLAATTGQWAMILAYGNANASVLAPFSYVQLIWASLFGIVVFGAAPGVWTFLGAAVISGSGVYIAYRERLKARAAQA